MEHEPPKPLDPTQQVKLLKEMKKYAAAKATGSKPDKRNKTEPSGYVIKKNKRKLANGESQLMLALLVKRWQAAAADQEKVGRGGRDFGRRS